MNLTRAQVLRFRKHPRKLVGTWWDLMLCHTGRTHYDNNVHSYTTQVLVTISKVQEGIATVTLIGDASDRQFASCGLTRPGWELPLDQLFSPFCALRYLGFGNRIRHRLRQGTRWHVFMTHQGSDHYQVVTDEIEGPELMCVALAILAQAGEGSLSPSSHVGLYELMFQSVAVPEEEWNTRLNGFAERGPSSLPLAPGATAETTTSVASEEVFGPLWKAQPEPDPAPPVPTSWERIQQDDE
jgi:hypothetical protein